MTKLRVGIGAVVIAVVAFFGGTALAGTSNDTMFKEKDYREFFKQEGNGDKNYLYTATEFKNSKGQLCVVVTGDSEQTIAIDCLEGNG